MSDFYSEIAAKADGRCLTQTEVRGIEAEYRAWADKEITTLRQQLEQAEARVAELEADNAHQRGRRNAARDCIQKMKARHQVEILRKQAEAVELLSCEWAHGDLTHSGREVRTELEREAQRLRDQADAAEKEGGE